MTLHQNTYFDFDWKCVGVTGRRPRTWLSELTSRSRGIIFPGGPLLNQCHPKNFTFLVCIRIFRPKHIHLRGFILNNFKFRYLFPGRFGGQGWHPVVLQSPLEAGFQGFGWKMAEYYLCRWASGKSAWNHAVDQVITNLSVWKSGRSFIFWNWFKAEWIKQLKVSGREFSQFYKLKLNWIVQFDFGQ